MRQWIVRAVVVATVIGAYALGRGFSASAEVPARARKPTTGQFVCGKDFEARQVPMWLQKECDPSRSFTVTYYPRAIGISEYWLFCCIGN